MLLPTANASEAAVVAGLTVLPVSTLAEAVGALNDPGAALPIPKPLPPIPGRWADLSDVRGQLLARRALEIAAAGAHNLLLVGPPASRSRRRRRRSPRRPRRRRLILISDPLSRLRERARGA